MHRRQALLFPVILSPLAMGLQACASSRPIEIGLHPWPGYEPLLVARQLGWLSDAVVLSEGQSARDSISGLKDGRLSAACLTLDEVLSVRAEGIPLTVVLVMNESVGADVVLVRPEIRNLPGLKGQRIAVERGAVGEVVLHKTLAAAGLDPKDLHIVNSPVDEHLAMWQAGAIDAAISFPPFAKLLQREGALRLFDSRRFPQTIFDVLAVHRERLKELGSNLNHAVTGHFRGLQHLRLNREDALRRIGAWRGMTFEETDASFRGLHLPSVEANRRLLHTQGILVRAAQQLSDLMMANNLLRAPDALKDLVSANHLPREV
jgi:NitT/TauT family transport system substrate-binding protein